MQSLVQNLDDHRSPPESIASRASNSEKKGESPGACGEVPDEREV